MDPVARDFRPCLTSRMTEKCYESIVLWSVRRRSFDVGRLAFGRRERWDFGPSWGHPARPTLGWKSQTGRPEGKRFAFHTRSMGTARPGASAAGQHLPQHVATVPIRLTPFNAKHTRSHSPRTFAKPRRLNRRNPSPIHPSALREPLALRVPGFARGARQFLTHAVRGREPRRATATWDLPSAQRYGASSRDLPADPARQLPGPVPPRSTPNVISSSNQLTLVAGRGPTGVATMRRSPSPPSARCSTAGIPRC